MPIKKSILPLLLCTNITLNASEDIPQDQEITPTCTICDNIIKKHLNMTFEDSVIDVFSKPLETHYPDALVLVKNDDNKWQLALTIDITASGDKRTVHVCNDHTSCEKNLEYIRELRPLWQYYWQPRIPITAIYDSCRLFIEHYRRANDYPYAQAKIIDPSHKIIVVGDLHGSSKSLRLIITRLYDKKILDDNCRLLPDYYFVFTGDYTDRGEHGGEVWHMLIKLKFTNPDQVFLLKGNHELLLMAKKFNNFYKEWAMITYGLNPSDQEKLLKDLFDSLPQALILGVRQSARALGNPPYRFLLFCHGGIDRSVTFHDIMSKAIAAEQSSNREKLVSCEIYYRANEMSGLMWSDFVANEPFRNWPSVQSSDRGNEIYKFNYSAICQFLDENSGSINQDSYRLDAIIRGHQHIPGGITRLEKTINEGSDWIQLETDITEPIERNSVYTCISSPEGLAPFGCCEDSYATIDWDSIKQQWLLTPHIESRVPKQWAHLVL